MTALKQIQSKEWQKRQEYRGKKVFVKSGRGWSFVAVLEHTTFGKLLYTPCGPIARDKNAFKASQLALQSISQAEDAIFIRIEPEPVLSPLELKNFGFRKIRPALLHRTTKNPPATWEFPIDITRYRLFNISRGITHIVNSLATIFTKRKQKRH